MDCAMPSNFSLVQLFANLWTVTHQASLSMGFLRQEYWSVVPCPPPEDLPDPGIKSVSLMSPALAGRFFNTMPPGKPTLDNNSVYKSIPDSQFVALPTLPPW